MNRVVITGIGALSGEIKHCTVLNTAGLQTAKFGEIGGLDDDLIKFTTPGQLRETWIPVEIIDDTGRLNGSMIRVADRVFRLADDMDIEEYE